MPLAKLIESARTALTETGEAGWGKGYVDDPSGHQDADMSTCGALLGGRHRCGKPATHWAPVVVGSDAGRIDATCDRHTSDSFMGHPLTREQAEKMLPAALKLADRAKAFLASKKKR